MFYTIELQKVVTSEDYTKGLGFYLVKYNGWSGMVDAINYFNPVNGFMLYLEPANIYPKEFLELFEEGYEKPKEIAEDGKMSMSEDFVLRLIAVSKVNTQSVKLNDIIK